MIIYDSLQKLVQEASQEKINISDFVLKNQCAVLEMDEQAVFNKMAKSYEIMKKAADEGMATNSKSASGLTGGDAYKMKQRMDNNTSIGGKVVTGILARALAVAETNACMGKIVAAPTAGSCGILPAVLLTIQEEYKLTDEKIVMSLFTASAIGMVISENATVAGAQGGCQAECGSASAMAAGAAVEAMGGTPEMVENACAIALKCILGLVCDPVAGLVEVPCVKRNASGAMNALSAAELALAGVESFIPADEVILAMKAIGDEMSYSLKETAKGGLAKTNTAKKFKL